MSAAARTMISANGKSLADYGFHVTAAPNLWDGFSVQDIAVQIPRRMGELITSIDPKVPGRDFTIEGLLVAATATARIAQEDALNLALYGSLLEITRIDLTSRARYGRAQQVVIAPVAPEFRALQSRVTIRVRCADPLAYDLTPTVIAFTTTPTTIPLGTTPLAPRILIANATAGTLTNFVLTQRTAELTSIATMTLTGALLTGEYLDVDHGLMSINKVDGSGVRTSARSWFTAGSYFVLRPGDTLEVDKGSGSALYYKSYF